MLVKEFRREFNQELADDYPEAEMSSFFFLLLTHFTGLSRLDLALYPERQLSTPQQTAFKLAVRQLKEHIPIQYIIGETEFYGLSFTVDPRVLVPRPETEELVDWICKDTSSSPYKRILDIGTGSGCIAVSLAKSLPEAEVSAVDVSKQALQLAKGNAKKNKAVVNFFRMDVLAPPQHGDRYDLIVSNPPYVRQSEKKQMARNVLEHEPHLALFVKDDDPLLFYRKILEFAEGNLAEGGQIYFEVNAYLKEDLSSLFEEKGIRDFVFKKDDFNKVRMVRVF